MPIGKNAIKRVSNSGYSNVQTSAPDMENSTIAKAEEAPKVEEPKVEAPKAQAPKIEAPATAPEVAPKKTAPKKTAKAPAPKKSMEREPELSPVATLKKVTKKAKPTQNRVCSYFAIGEELPIYLL